MDPKISVEYLFISKLSDSICIDDSGLRNILRSIRDVEVKNNTLKYKDVEFEFEIVHGNAESDKSVYFDITISTIPENLDPFAEVLRLIRTAINKITQNPPQVLWDGLGLYYSQLAYPKIYRVENMMRKLITKFMIINAGIGWHKQFVPKEVDQSIKSQANNDYLHNVDFIQLSVFLFKEYEVVATKPILEKIRKSSEVTALDLSELKGLVPQSNWDRYFAPIISCDADFLRTRWQALYDLRNAVAHNKSISRTDKDSD